MGTAAGAGPAPGTGGRFGGVWERVQTPGFFTATSQTIKGVIAATFAWWFSMFVLETELPFLAPWTALLTVHATVYQSLSRGTQSAVSSVIGVGLSFVIGNYLGVSVWTYALALLVGLVAAYIRWIRDEGVAIATTAIFLLSSGFEDQEPLLIDRMVEVGVGVAVGVAVNLIIIPPLRDQQAASHVDSINRRMGKVLVDMADQLAQDWDTDNADEWISEAQSMARDTATAWDLVHSARESHRANPRAYLHRSGLSRNNHPTAATEDGGGYADILARVDEGISHLLNLARTLRQASYVEGPWNDRFRSQWVDIVRDCGRAIADPDAEVEPIDDRLMALANDLSDDQDLPQSAWPIYGSLITSVRHIALIVDDVASSREARESD
ncbi:aromatic acid exporter family protein [Citricoccus sp. NPDC055426]|uniref:FUSC family protein n=1 Tax=Citricoccus sp. NPDC055426 TaxID=3155536 RepID=UPI00343977CD